jgi:serine/threonine protein kinase
VLVEEYLSSVPEWKPSSEELLDLICAEQVERADRGDGIDPEEYLKRFPQFRAELGRLHSVFSELMASFESPSPALVETKIVTTAGSTTQPPPSTSFGKYQLLERLGSGGQADVYRAFDNSLNRDVALKILKRSASDLGSTNEVRRQLLTEEGRALARMDHPNIAVVHELGIESETPFLAVEFVQGRNLAQASQIRRPGPTEVAELMAVVAEALEAAHRVGVVHRDLKPQNILITADDQPKVIDFGLARLSSGWSGPQEATGVQGTVAFMAPEQAADEEAVGPSTDIFGACGVLYFLLTGHAPYEGTSWQELWSAVTEGRWNRERLLSPTIPRELARICERGLSRHAKDRQSSAAELVGELRSYLGRRKARQALIPLLTGLLLLGVGWRLMPDRASDRSERSPAMSLAPLRVQVFRESAGSSLEDAVPLVNGDEIQIHSRVPTGIAVTLVNVTGSGELKVVASEAAQQKDRNWSYPGKVGETVELNGTPGTECLILIGTEGAVLTEAELRDAWANGNDAWLAMPPGTLLRVAGDKLEFLQTSRDLGAPRSGANPIATIQSRLAKFHQRLNATSILLEGVVFSHEEPADM